jgi:SWIM zinc finger
MSNRSMSRHPPPPKEPLAFGMTKPIQDGHGVLVIERGGLRGIYLVYALAGKGGVAYRLAKQELVQTQPGWLELETTATYDLHLNDAGGSCTCPAQQYQGHRGPCKHLVALAGLRASGQLAPQTAPSTAISRERRRAGR